METFVKLFGSLLAFIYHCFDRIVILGHLPLLTRPENIVHFFRDVQRCRYTHYYFYIRDEVLGPMAMCVGSFLPFQITYYLNGHHYIDRELLRRRVAFRKDDNAFVAVSDPAALQAAADRLSADLIRKRLDYWTLIVGPKFSKADRQVINLKRHCSIQQVEYCRNLVFHRNFPIHKLFERSCDIGLLRLTPDKITQIFGFRINKKLHGKLQSVLDQMEHGHHVFRACGRNAVLRMYEKFTTFLRLEALSNNLKDFGLKKSLQNLDAVRRKLAAVSDRFAAFEAEALNVHVGFPLFQRMALPITSAVVACPALRSTTRASSA